MNKLVDFYKSKIEFYNGNTYIAKVLINVVTFFISILVQRLLIKNTQGLLLFLTIFLLYIVLCPVISYLFYRIKNIK